MSIGNKYSFIIIITNVYSFLEPQVKKEDKPGMYISFHIYDE